MRNTYICIYKIDAVVYEAFSLIKFLFLQIFHNGIWHILRDTGMQATSILIYLNVNFNILVTCMRSKISEIKFRTLKRVAIYFDKVTKHEDIRLLIVTFIKYFF